MTFKLCLAIVLFQICRYTSVRNRPNLDITILWAWSNFVVIERIPLDVEDGALVSTDLGMVEVHSARLCVWCGHVCVVWACVWCGCVWVCVCVCVRYDFLLWKRPTYFLKQLTHISNFTTYNYSNLANRREIHRVTRYTALFAPTLQTSCT